MEIKRMMHLYPKRQLANALWHLRKRASRCAKENRRLRNDFARVAHEAGIVVNLDTDSEDVIMRVRELAGGGHTPAELMGLYSEADFDVEREKITKMIREGMDSGMAQHFFDGIACALLRIGVPVTNMENCMGMSYGEELRKRWESYLKDTDKEIEQLKEAAVENYVRAYCVECDSRCDNDEDGCCPTCGTEVTWPEDYIKRLESQLADARSAVAGVKPNQCGDGSLSA